ncbi:hypothetical protein Tco_0783803 [Tanacetum coccineum]
MVIILSFTNKLGALLNNVCEGVLEFFNYGKLLGEVNSTLISLVPKGDTPQKSVKVVKTVVDECSCLTGLNPNMGKSTVFFGNIKDDVKKEILKVLPFKVGKLPVTYLGVPFITKQIGLNECTHLIDNGDLSRGKAKVACKKVCKPNSQGRLRIKDLSEWNECLMGKQICNVVSNKGLYGSNGST